MEGFAMSHGGSQHRGSAEGQELLKTERLIRQPDPRAGATKARSGSSDGAPVPIWKPIFVLCAIGFGLLVLALKAIGLL
jgi:hypothetical protein